MVHTPSILHLPPFNTSHASSTQLAQPPLTSRSSLPPKQAQTPQQRRANNQFARAEEKKRGKPQGEAPQKQKPTKAPISQTWVCTSS